ncbi:uncharacterized protein BP5553_08458 [Venustampulla echinocandica]|uniref:Zn(2)-C6 fungal-type domain-containing protein n=1 Tax=Venustampulla echinocandica TaxID=2656787 RepID=A0A370TE99_9HELO|nr:uncharacterized protein BP5553_08458 [Venustampulla echinocandica]RDL33019.1 hypothetical protein BP5553_08458 [Venustampulla echinocandica]
MPASVMGLQPAPAKMFHTKSRTGCQLCRARRVKCNEAKPSCSHCARHRIPCLYDRNRETFASNKRSTDGPFGTFPAGSTKVAEVPSPRNGSDGPPESKARRTLELRLLHQYMSKTGPAIAIDDHSRSAWCELVPLWSFRSEALQYAMYSVAALHIAKADAFKDPIMIDAHQTYLEMALREHTTIFKEAWTLASDGEESIAAQWIRGLPIALDTDARLGEDKRRGFLHLLRRKQSDELTEPWDKGIQEAYEHTLSYIGGIWIAVNNHEATGDICRRLVVFPMLAPPRFLDLVEELRPRALVILMHYFALLSLLRDFWYIGDGGEREVYAIKATLVDEWLDFVSWPLEIMKTKLSSPYR